jgi:hypothetical protein
MLLQLRKRSEKADGFTAVRFIRLFWIGEESDVLLFVLYRYAGTPFLMLFMPVYPFIAAFVSHVSFSILSVLRVVRFSQVSPTIVLAVPILVVQDTVGPRSGHPKPRYSVNQIWMPVYRYSAFTFVCRISRFLSFVSRVKLFRKRVSVLPIKFARCWFIVQDRSHVFSREVVAKFYAACFGVLSHSTLLRSFRLEAGERANALACLAIYAMERSAWQL